MRQSTRKLMAMLLAASLIAGTAAGCSSGGESTGTTAARAAGTPAKPAAKPAAVKLAHVSSKVTVPGMEKIAESEVLTLFLNRETTEIAVVDKRTGSVWYSNPQDRGEDAKAQGVTKDQLSSQVSVVYYNDEGQKYTLNNYSDSIRHKQFEIAKTDKGVKIVYQFGDPDKGLDALPRLISKERFEALLEKVPEKSRRNVKNKYRLQEGKDVYERWDKALAGVNLKRTVEAFRAAGYTEEDLALDNKMNNAEGAAGGNAKPKFTVPLEYRLEGDQLVAVVNAAEISYPEQFPLHKVHVLDFFGAAGSRETGYMFVPDGSGSLIYLNNGKLAQEPYAQPVYGTDNTSGEVLNSQTSETTRLPVFGMKKGDDAFLAVIDKGEALATVNADVSGRINSYNYVFANFTMLAKDELKMYGGWSGENTIQIFPAAAYRGELSIRYSFLSGDKATYSGMAGAYRDHLARTYGWKPEDGGKGVPFYLDLVGDIPRRTSFLGIPYNKMEPLTTFDEAAEIVGSLERAKVSNLQVRMSGWFNKGFNHAPPVGIDVDGALGGRRGLTKLAKALEEKGIGFYPDVSFLNIYKNNGDFSPTRDAARLISRRVARVYPYDPATYKWADDSRSAYYILSPRVLPSVVKGFADDYRKLGIDGLSLRDLGYEVNSDYKVGKTVDRASASVIIAGQTASLEEQFKNLLLIGGNANALGYAKHVLQAPETDSRFGITDTGIPFYQMAIRGYVSYAGMPVNLSDDQDIRMAVLRALETGSGVYFQWMHADPAAIKDTEFTWLYSANYRYWLEDAVKMYEEVNEVLGDTAGVPITEHEILAPGVSRTTYGNGKTVIVNSTRTPFAAEGISVEPMDYLVGGEQQ